MACTKSELFSAINSFATARVSNDANLLKFSIQLLEDTVNTLEFASESNVEESVSGVTESQD